MKNALTRSALRRPLSASAVAGVTAALLLAGMPGAAAHVGATPDKTAANSRALLTFGIPHGCDTAGTTKVTITLPPELDDAQPTVNPNWTVAKVEEDLPEPKQLADGASITKRTSQIVYTAKAPLDPKFRDALVLSVKLPDTPGKTLYFPTLQDCEQGQTDWSQIPTEGQGHDALKTPAPSVTVTAAEAGAHGGHGAAAGSGAAAETRTAPEAGSTPGESAHPESAHPDSAPAAERAAAVTDDGAQLRSWAGLIAGLGGLVLGGLAFLRRPAPRN